MRRCEIVCPVGHRFLRSICGVTLDSILITFCRLMRDVILTSCALHPRRRFDLYLQRLADRDSEAPAAKDQMVSPQCTRQTLTHWAVFEVRVWTIRARASCGVRPWSPRCGRS